MYRYTTFYNITLRGMNKRRRNHINCFRVEHWISRSPPFRFDHRKHSYNIRQERFFYHLVEHIEQKTNESDLFHHNFNLIKRKLHKVQTNVSRQQLALSGLHKNWYRTRQKRKIKWNKRGKKRWDETTADDIGMYVKMTKHDFGWWMCYTLERLQIRSISFGVYSVFII